jgi:hypothetical protein
MCKLSVSRIGLMTTLTLVAVFPAAVPAARAVSRPAAVGTPPTMSACLLGLSNQHDIHFEVSACKGAGATAAEKAALAIADQIYKPMTDLMGPPLADCTPRPACARHGGGQINLYLLKPGQTLTRDGRTDGLASDVLGEEIDSAKAGPVSSSGYILLGRAMAQANPAAFRSVVVHEFFHVLTAQYNNSDGCLRNGKTYWFVEASAKWAESYWARPTAPAYVYSYFPDYQMNPDISLTDVIHRSAYADFIWPYFMQQQDGVLSIADTWRSRAMAGARTCAQMTSAMNSVFSFAKNFKDFAVENFDTKLVNPATGIKEWPQGFGPAYPEKMDSRFPELEPKLAVLGPFIKPSKVTVPANIPPLSTVYQVINVKEPAGGLALDFSGINNRAGLDVAGLITETSGPYGQHPWKRISVAGNYLSVCSYADNEQEVRLILVLANHSTTAAVSGSYTVTARTSCADTASATVTVIQKGLWPFTSSPAVTATIKANVFWVQCPNCLGLTQDLSRGGGSWSVTGTIPNCDGMGTTGTVAGSGSYTPWYGSQSGWIGGSAYGWNGDGPPGLQISGYMYPPPKYTCGNLTSGVVAPYGPIWPHPYCLPSGPLFEQGKWVNPQHTMMDLTCTASDHTGVITVSGTVKATGVILCGAFTPNCPIEIPPYLSARKP